jgi:hypothetical protein
VTAVERPIARDPAATYDALDRKQPQRIGFMQLARAIPGYASQYTGRVPPEFYAQVSVEEVDIACPCGNTPRCYWMVPKRCNCDRFFVYTGGDVRVARTGES